MFRSILHHTTTGMTAVAHGLEAGVHVLEDGVHAVAHGLEAGVHVIEEGVHVVEESVHTLQQQAAAKALPVAAAMAMATGCAGGAAELRRESSLGASASDESAEVGDYPPPPYYAEASRDRDRGDADDAAEALYWNSVDAPARAGSFDAPTTTPRYESGVGFGGSSRPFGY